MSFVINKKPVLGDKQARFADLQILYDENEQLVAGVFRYVCIGFS